MQSKRKSRQSHTRLFLKSKDFLGISYVNFLKKFNPSFIYNGYIYIYILSYHTKLSGVSFIKVRVYRKI